MKYILEYKTITDDYTFFNQKQVHYLGENVYAVYEVSNRFRFIDYFNDLSTYEFVTRHSIVKVSKDFIDFISQINVNEILLIDAFGVKNGIIAFVFPIYLSPEQRNVISSMFPINKTKVNLDLNLIFFEGDYI